MRKTLFFSVLPLLVLFLLPHPSSCAQPPAPFSATLIASEGQVQIQKKGGNLWLPVEKGMPLEQGDHLKTGAQSSAEILADDGSQIKLEENSEITLGEMSADPQTQSLGASVYLWSGRMLSSIRRLANSRSRFEVQTPTVVAEARGTDFAVEVLDTRQTDVGVFDGEVAVAGLDRQNRVMRDSEIVLGKGYQSSVFKNKPPGAPVHLRERMLSLAPQFDLLRSSAADRRRDLQKTMERRQWVHQETLKKWKAIKSEQSNPAKKPGLVPPGGGTVEPKTGTERKVPPKNTMKSRTELQAREGLQSKEAQPGPKVEPPEKRETLKKPATQPAVKTQPPAEKP